MRVLYVTFPWRTHFQPAVPLCWALQTAGHEVRVASGPELTDVIVRSGLTAVPVGSDVPVLQKMAEMQTPEAMEAIDHLGYPDDLLYEFADNREEKLTWDRLPWLTAFLTELHKVMNDSMIEDLVEYCRWWKPDLVLWNYMSYAGSVAATAVGAAHARLPTEMDLNARFRRDFLRVRAQQPAEDRWDALADWLGGWADRYGASFSEEMVTGHFTVDHMLGSMRLEQDVPVVPMRYVPYHGPAVVPDWLRADPTRRRVLATFGVSQQQGETYQALSVEQLQDMLDALSDLDIELVGTLSPQIQQELGRVPGNVRLVEFVALNVITWSCSAVIHNGSTPSFMEAIACRVPQLMVGRVCPDIEERGPLLERAGAGLWIPQAELKGARVRDDVVRLLDEPGFRDGTERLRRELYAQPTPGEVTRDLEQLTGRYRSR